MMGTFTFGKVGDLTVYGGIPCDIKDAWDCFVDCADIFFTDYDNVYDANSWACFAATRITDVALARNKAGEICCISYVMPETADSLCFHAGCRPDHRKPSISIPCAQLAIRYFFLTHQVRRMSVVGLWKNRVARLCAMKLGFTIDGRPRSIAPVKGEFLDVYYGSLLRKEVM